LPPNQLQQQQQQNIKMFTAGRPITLLAVLFIASLCYEVAYGNQKCCGCCKQNSVGVNSNCVILGLIDLTNPPTCDSGSILVCTATLCKPTQTCDLNAGNLVCANV
jgi:hypothetical protein